MPFSLTKAISEELLRTVCGWQGGFSSGVGAWEADTLDRQKDLTSSLSMYKHYVLFRVFLSQCWVINRSFLCMLNLPTNFEALEEDGGYEIAQYFLSLCESLNTCVCNLWLLHPLALSSDDIVLPAKQLHGEVRSRVLT